MALPAEEEIVATAHHQTHPGATFGEATLCPLPAVDFQGSHPGT